MRAWRFIPKLDEIWYIGVLIETQLEQTLDYTTLIRPRYSDLRQIFESRIDNVLWSSRPDFDWIIVRCKNSADFVWVPIADQHWY